MFKTIISFADTLNHWVNRAEYIFKLVNWSIETVRMVADRLHTFPIPTNENDNGKNSSDESTPGAGAGTETKPEPVTVPQ
jgi:hypothetical protein